MCSFESLFWAAAVGFVTGFIPRKQILLRFRLGRAEPKQRIEPTFDIAKDVK